MTEFLRQEQHMAEKGRVCPGCGRKDTMEFWKRKGFTLALDGTRSENMVRIKPTCSHCHRVYPNGTAFKEIR